MERPSMNAKEFFESLHLGDECTIEHASGKRTLVFLSKVDILRYDEHTSVYKFDNKKQQKGTVLELIYPTHSKASDYYNEWLFENVTHSKNREKIKLWKELVDT